MTNPYLHLLDEPPPPDTFSATWGARVRLVYRWTYRAEALAEAQAALDAVPAAFDAEVVERRERWVELRHLEGHKKEVAIHRSWLERRNSIREGRLADARQRVAACEAALREVERELDELMLVAELATSEIPK